MNGSGAATPPHLHKLDVLGGRRQKRTAETEGDSRKWIPETREKQRYVQRINSASSVETEELQ